MSLSVDQFYRFFIKPLTIKQENDKHNPQLSHWSGRWVCLLNCLIVPIKDVKDEWQDVVNGVLMLGQLFKGPESLKNHCLSILDTGGAIVIRPFAMVADVIKLLIGAIIYPYVSIRLETFNSQEKLREDLMRQTDRVNQQIEVAQTIVDRLLGMLNDPSLKADYKQAYNETRHLLLPPPKVYKAKLANDPTVAQWSEAQHKIHHLDKIRMRIIDFLKKNPAFAHKFMCSYNAKYPNDFTQFDFSTFLMRLPCPVIPAIPAKKISA